MNPFRVAGISRSLGHCPRCPERDLEVRRARELAIASCDRCFGMWLEGATLLDLLTAGEADLAHLARADQGAIRDRPAPVRCPRCHLHMRREIGTIVDYDTCPEHGLWFDGGELRAVLAAAGVTALDGSEVERQQFLAPDRAELERQKFLARFDKLVRELEKK